MYKYAIYSYIPTASNDDQFAHCHHMSWIWQLLKNVENFKSQEPSDKCFEFMVNQFLHLTLECTGPPAYGNFYFW